jgi:integrase
MGRKATGYVEVLPASIRLSFHFQGKQRREIVPNLKPTPAKNVRYAEQLLATINFEIANGLFNYAEHFPESKFVKEGQKLLNTDKKAGTLGFYLDTFLQSKANNASATKAQYANAANIWRGIFGDDTQLKKLLPSAVSSAVSGYSWASDRMYNNTLIPLRGALKMARTDSKSYPDFLANVSFRKRSNSKPNPLTPIQMHEVLDWIKENKDLRAWAYFAFAFATGMRPEELIALRWADVDEKRLKITVCRAKTFKGELKDTKTKGEREVDLGPLAREALQTIKPWTNPKGISIGTIFENPYTDRDWHSNKAPHIRIWLPALKAKGISSRRAYCTRHTFATLLLQSGARVAYVSNQMGHTTPSEVEKTYSKWLPDADGGYARRMIESAFDRP